MNLLLASVVVASFAWLLGRLGVIRRARLAAAAAGETAKVLRDSTLTDQEKERAMRRRSIELFQLAGGIVLASLAALGAPIFVLWLLDLADLVSLHEVVDILQRLDFLVVASLLGYGAYRSSRGLVAR